MHNKYSKILVILPAILLCSYLVFRLINVSQIMFNYPFSSEAVTQITQLFFLKECGFHNYCPYWYGGINTFLVTPPGWYFFTLPFVWPTQNYLISTYIALVISLLIIGILFLYFGKYLGLTKIQRLIFFSFVMANSLMINKINSLRTHEIFAWANFFICSFLLLYYQKRPLDKKFLILSSFFYFVTLISHQNIAILLTIFFSGFILMKTGKEKLKASLPLLFGIISSSFWWIPFVSAKLRQEISIIPAVGVTSWRDIAGPNFTNFALFILPISFLLMFFLFWRSKKYERSVIVLFFPSIVLAALFMSGLVQVIPLLKNIITYSYFIYFVFLAVYCFLEYYPRANSTKLLFAFLAFLAVFATLTISIVGTPLFQKAGQTEQDIISLTPSIEGRYIFVNKFPSSFFPPAHYGYAAVYYDKSTASGWAPHMKNNTYLSHLNIFKTLTNSNCDTFLNNAKILGLQSFIGYGKTCDIMSSCGLTYMQKSGEACLYRNS